MTARDFYRILSRVQGMQWMVKPMPIEKFGVPSRTTFILGIRHAFEYSPLSAVASAVRRRIANLSRTDLNTILHLDPALYRRIKDATYQRPGYSPIVRRKLLKSCRLPWYGPTS